MIEEQTNEEVLNAFYPADEAEPLGKPTEEAAADEEPEENEEESEEDSTEEDSTEEDSEDDASDDELEDDETNEDGDILVYEINGKEYTAKDIKLLETNDKLRQADYTRKTQEHARKVEEDTANLSEAITKTNELAEQLEVLVGEDKLLDIESYLDIESENYDPEEYVKLKKRADNRKAKLDEIKANNVATANSSFSPESERVKLVEANPQWVEDGKPTKAYTDDMTALSNYYTEHGVTQEEAQFISQNARVVMLVLDDAKRKAESKASATKKAETRKKIIKSPKATKPKAQTNGLSAEEIFYGSPN